MKVFFFDVDKTLIDMRNNIAKPTEKTKAAISELKRQGHKVILATGRPRCILMKELEALDFDGFISSNGADVTIGDEVIYRNIIDKDMVSLLLENEEKYGYESLFESHEHMHSRFSEGGPTMDLFEKYQLPAEMIVDNFEADLFKAQVLFDKEKFKETHIADVEKLLGGKHLLPYEKYFFDVYDKEVNKGKGVAEVMKYYNLPEEKYYAFGDAMNDYEMMELVPNSICMGNGDERLQEICRFNTNDVENEGIYCWLKNNNII